MPLPLTPISRISSANVSRHVRFGLPRLLLPPSGVQSNTKLAGLDVGRRSTCPMNLLRLVATVSCRSLTPALCRSSSFIIWPFHDTPSMSRRHLLLNTLSILFVLSVKNRLNFGSHLRADPDPEILVKDREHFFHGLVGCHISGKTDRIFTKILS